MKIKLVILILLLVMISSLFAFDGKRDGFLLGFGLGLANVSYEQEREGYGETITGDTETEVGTATDFKIGFAPNNKVEIYYSSQVAWFRMMNVYSEDVSISDGVGTLSFSYFVSPALNKVEWAPSLYLSAGFGFSAWSTPDYPEAKSSTGSGGFIGVGYEFAKHYRISANIFFNNPSIIEEGTTLTTNSTALLFTISAMAF